MCIAIKATVTVIQFWTIRKPITGTTEIDVFYVEIGITFIRTAISARTGYPGTRFIILPVWYPGN